jgi:hypothetical protein
VASFLLAPLGFGLMLLVVFVVAVRLDVRAARRRETPNTEA